MYSFVNVVGGVMLNVVYAELTGVATWMTAGPRAAAEPIVSVAVADVNGEFHTTLESVSPAVEVESVTPHRLAPVMVTGKLDPRAPPSGVKPLIVGEPGGQTASGAAVCKSIQGEFRVFFSAVNKYLPGEVVPSVPIVTAPSGFGAP